MGLQRPKDAVPTEGSLGRRVQPDMRCLNGGDFGRSGSGKGNGKESKASAISKSRYDILGTCFTRFGIEKKRCPLQDSNPIELLIGGF